MIILCKGCHRKITKKEATYKKRQPIWWHDQIHTRWWFYTGYFCKKCAAETKKNSKFLGWFFFFWLTSWLVFSIVLLFIIKPY